MPRSLATVFPSSLRPLVVIGLIAILNFSGNLIWVDMASWLDRHSGAAGDEASQVLFACMLGQIVTTFMMARYGPERRVALWLILACALEALGVFGMLAAPTGAVFVGTGILATAAWQATLPLATGLYLAVGGRSHGQFVLPVSLGGMALASSVAEDVSPQRIIGLLAAVVVVLGAGLVGLEAARRHRAAPIES